ncbi:MAG: flagellar FliJ family protein [Elusimicrobia bacterium]|nr:flagellar FliJ family protein [Elusimicrobiota bacterium]
MKKFLFRLETPLRLRRRKVDRASQDLARARSEVLSVRRELERLEKEHAHWALSHPVTADGDMDLARDGRRVEYMDHLESLMFRQKEALVPLRARVSACEGALQKAVRDRQILERLKELRKKTYWDEIRALETKRSDFAASAMFRRSI